jgi:hypothetical protein
MGKLEAICAGLIFIIGFFSRNLFSKSSKPVVLEEKVKDASIKAKDAALTDPELDALLAKDLGRSEKPNP